MIDKNKLENKIENHEFVRRVGKLEVFDHESVVCNISGVETGK